SQIIAGTTTLLNAARAKIQGVDVEAVWAPPVPTGSLRLSTNFSVIDAKYKKFPGAPAFYPASPAGAAANAANKPAAFTGCGSPTRTEGQIGCLVDASGNDVIYTPKFSGTLAADYTYPLADA